MDIDTKTVHTIRLEPTELAELQDEIALALHMAALYSDAVTDCYPAHYNSRVAGSVDELFPMLDRLGSRITVITGRVPAPRDLLAILGPGPARLADLVIEPAALPDDLVAGAPRPLADQRPEQSPGQRWQRRVTAGHEGDDRC